MSVLLLSTRLHTDMAGCLTLILLSAAIIVAFGTLPITDCPEYVPENTKLSCSCLAPENFKDQGSFSWPGHSYLAILTINNVTRDKNGTLYTCRMVAGGTITLTDYILKVSYGPHDNRIEVTPLEFVTNWIQPLIVNCYASDVYPVPTYTWDDIVCKSNKGRTCIFLPPKGVKTLKATCIAKLSLTGYGNKLASKSVQLTFKYPPPDPPNITSHAGAEVLRTGDTLTCTVTGGRPAVDKIIFYCTDPQLTGRRGEASTTSVSSTITVNSARATENNMKCFCSAVWKPNARFYGIVSQISYGIEFKTLVKRLTLNSITEVLTVAAEDHVTILLVCQTFGRPRPTDVKLTKVDNDSFADAHKVEVSNTGRWESKSTVTLLDVQCSDMGTYVCTASNGVGPADSRNVVLNVRCPPRKSFNEVLEITGQGFSFSLAAYPSPDNFRFFHLGNRTSGNGSEVSSGRFSSLCLQNAVTLSTVNCTITPVDVPKSLLGFYRATLSNGLGSVDITFSVDKEVIPPKMDDNRKRNLAIIIGVTVAIIAAMGIAVVYSRLKANPRTDDAVFPPTVSTAVKDEALPSRTDLTKGQPIELSPPVSTDGRSAEMSELSESGDEIVPEVESSIIMFSDDKSQM